MHVDSAGAAGDSSGLAPMLAIRSWIMANAFGDITVAKVAVHRRFPNNDAAEGPNPR